MPIAVGFYALAVVAAGLFVLAGHNASKNASKSAPTIVNSHKNRSVGFMEILKAKVITGLAFWGIKIWSQNLKENSLSNSIKDSFDSETGRLGNSLGRASQDIANLSNGITNNVSSDIIDGIQGAINSIPVSSENEITVDNFWAPAREDTPSITGVPAMPKEEATIIDIPASDIPSPSIIDFPAIPKAIPQITGIPADSGVDVPSVWGVPMPNRQNMDDLVLKSDGNSIGVSEASMIEKNTSGLPDWLKERFEAGNNFNKENRPRYPYNEVEVNGKKKYVVDSYVPAEEIVSRKYTQLADVQESTGIGYLNELKTKYPSGAIITNSPFNPKVLRGQPMRGQQILEIPVQNKAIPQRIIDYANDNNIIIRDVEGKVYN